MNCRLYISVAGVRIEFFPIDSGGFIVKYVKYQYDNNLLFTLSGIATEEQLNEAMPLIDAAKNFYINKHIKKG